jgi:hypothetical protein
VRSLIGIAIACCTLFVANCASVPTLEETTGATEPPPLFVNEVVLRVKCEIYETALALSHQPKFAWTNDWTAKVNLTLAVNNTAGLTPSVATVQFLPSAYYNAKTATGATLLTGVQQKFLFGANLALQESATRSDFVAFTVGFGDILSNVSNERPEGCERTGKGRALYGDLGLKEWVDSAFSPVGKGQLLAGKLLEQRKDHLQTLIKWLLAINSGDPVKAGAAFWPAIWESVKALQDPCLDQAFLVFFGPKLIRREDDAQFGQMPQSIADEVEKHERTLVAQCKFITELIKNSNVKQKIDTAKTTVATSLQEAKEYRDKTIAPYDRVLQNSQTRRNLDTAINQLTTTYELVDKLVIKTTFYQSGFWDFQEARDCQKKEKETTNDKDKDDMTPNFPHERQAFKETLQTLVESEWKDSCWDLFGKFLWANFVADRMGTFQADAKQIADYIKSFKPAKPIDSLTHTVTFVVTYGAGIQPNWTLIVLNGPLTQLANAQGIRTHTLLIAIGPEEENKINIQNATVTNATAPH